MAAFVFCCAGSTAQDVEEGGADGGGPVGAMGGLSGAKRNPRVSSCVQGYLLCVASLGCFIWAGLNAGCRAPLPSHSCYHMQVSRCH